MTANPFGLNADVVTASPRIYELAVQLLRNRDEIGSRHGWVGRGYDPSSSEHATKRALDFIISAKVGRMPTASEKTFGDLVCDWLIGVAEAAQIRHIIWYGRIWKRRYRHTKAAWSNLVGRKSVSDWHYDHIHVFLDNSNGRIPAISFTLEKEIEMADPKEIVETMLNYPMTANGKRQELVQHFADMIVATHAQSLAVTSERDRDKANVESLRKDIREVRDMIAGLM